MATARRRSSLPARSGDVAGLGVVGAALVATYGQLAAGRPLAGYDVTNYSLPNWVEVSRALRSGRLPLWDPYRLLGSPLVANPQAAVFYPLHWVLALLPPDRGQSLSIVVHLMVAGIGSYVFARRALHVRPLAAAVAGVAYGAGGFAHGHAGQYEQVTALAWVPWTLVAADAALRPASWRAAGAAMVALAATVALTALAGHSQYVHMELVAVGLYAVMVATPTWRCVRVAAGALVGLGLAGVQLVPTVVLAGRSVRSGGLDYRAATELSLPLGRLVATFLPHYRSGPTMYTEWWAWLPWSALALAALAVPVRWRRRPVAALAVLAVVGTVLALGSSTPLFRPALALVPGLDRFRVPARWLLLPAVALPALAAVGLDLLLDRRRRPAWPAAVTAAGVVMAAGIGGSVGYSSRPSWGSVATGVAASTVVVGAWWSSRATARRVGAAVLIVGLLTVETVAASTATYVHRFRMPAGSLLARSTTAAALDEPTGARVLSVGGGSLDDFPDQRRSLRPNANVFDRLRSPDGYDGGLLYTRAWTASMRRLLRDPGFDPLLTVRPQVSRPLDPALFAELDVRRVVAADTGLDLASVLPPGSSRRATVGPVQIWDTPTLGPVFEAGATAPTQGLALRRRLDRPERLAVDIPAGLAGRRIVVSEAWAPGWHSHGTDLRAYDGLLLSFVAPPGPVTVVLHYSEPGLLPGAALTAGAAALCVVLLAVAVRARPVAADRRSQELPAP